MSRFGMRSSRFRALPDYNRRAWEWKSLADAVFDEPLEREMKLLKFVRKHDKRRRIDFDLRNVTYLNVGGQAAPRKHFLTKEFVQVPRGYAYEACFVHFLNRSIQFLD